MEMRNRRVLLCDCEKTMPLDAKGLEKACRAAGATGDLDLETQLCRAQLGNVQQALLGDGPVMIGCTQEAPLFNEVVAETNPQADVAYVNIRETAGWSAEAESRDAKAKIAALIAEAALDIPATPSVSYESNGVCLVYGRDETALEVAKRLTGRLEVTVLLKEPGEVLPPRVMDVPEIGRAHV